MLFGRRFCSDTDAVPARYSPPCLRHWRGETRPTLTRATAWSRPNPRIIVSLQCVITHYEAYEAERGSIDKRFTDKMDKARRRGVRRQRQSLSVKQQTACCVTERQQAGKPVRKLGPTAARRQQNFAAIGAAARRVDVSYNCRSSFNAFPRGVVCVSRTISRLA